MFVCIKALPGASFAFPGMRIVAAALLVAAVVVGVVSVRTFRRHGTTVNPLAPGNASAIVTVGIYGYTRNPMYLALALALAAWGVYLGNVASLALVAVFVMYLTRFQIMPEERALEGLFGDEFREYKWKVRRWI